MKRPDTTQYLKRRQVADMLAVSERTIDRLTRQGTLPPPLRIGRSLRWDEARIRETVSRLSTDGVEHLR
jgi:predicted DNA-binding transcriptional regulator AlpA